jgi:membrane-associated protease RseP (regulator of RpoE activity)
MRHRLSDERGQASVEFAGVLFWLLLTAFVVWQLLLVTWTFNSASNAARTASRVDGRGGDAVKAGRAALSPGLREGAKIKMEGEKATVRVRIPLIVPGLNTDKIEASRSAELPG